MIVNRLLPRTRAVGAAEAEILGRNDNGTGGFEGVLNGASRAVVTVVSSIADIVAVFLERQATRDAEWVRWGTSWAIPANDDLTLLLSEEQCAGYAIRLVASCPTAGDVSVASQMER